MLKKTNVEKEIQIGDLNNRNFVRFGISIFFKVIIVTFFIASITQTYVSGGYSRWFDPLMYFTTLSNIFIAVVDLIFIVLLIIQAVFEMSRAAFEYSKNERIQKGGEW